MAYPLGEVATNFSLREIDLAMLDLHSDTISFDVLAATVAVRLSASKGDPRTDRRSHTIPCRPKISELIPRAQKNEFESCKKRKNGQILNFCRKMEE